MDPVPAAAATERAPEQAFGALLRRHRHAAGLTQEELAERAGLGVRNISDLERGAPHAPRKDTVALLAKALTLEAGAQAAFAAAARRLARPPSDAAPLIAPSGAFACFAREDRDFVERLRADLAAHGLVGWEEGHEVRPGTAGGQEAVRAEIRACQAVLLIASPAARTSRSVTIALTVAEFYARPVVPVWAAGEQWLDCVPPALGATPYIDARDLCYPQAVEAIAAFLGTPRAAALTAALGVAAPTRNGAPAVAAADAPQAVARSVPPRNPYKGLRAFAEQDAGDFFGREDLVNELLAAVHSLGSGDRFLAVLGPSGSGKSSVVLAGLAPRLKAGALPGSASWTYLPPLVPGAHPLEALSVSLGTTLPVGLAAIRADLDASDRGLHLLAARIDPRPDARVVLVVDQAEELFTLTDDENERERFIAMLVTAACEPRGHTVVVLTLRADFYDRPLAYPALGRLLERHAKVVLPMNLADLRAAIERPAALPGVGLRFEADLVGDLLYELRGQAGALPLLQFTLDQLFERREGHLLTQEGYTALGGVRGALARHAERTYTSLPSAEHRQLARALFLRLIEPGATEQDTTRRRAPLADLELADRRRTALLRAVADAFIGARLLTAAESGGVITLEVSHEALIREWARLAAWLREARDDVRLHHALNADAATWEWRERPADALYRGTVLAEAQAWANRNTPSVGEEAFLAAAAEEERRRQEAERDRQARELAVARRAATADRRAATRLRALVAVLAVFLLAAAGLAALAQSNGSQATRQRDAARTAQRLALSRQLAAQALNQMDSHFDLALLLSLQSYRLLGTAQARNGLLPALEARSPGLVAFLGGTSLGVNELAMSRDGALLISGNEDGTIRFWDLRRRTASGSPLKSADGAVGSVALSPDGRLLASADLSGNVQLWDVASRGHDGPALKGTSAGIGALAFSPNGKVIAVACGDNTIRLWDVRTRRPLAFSPLQGEPDNANALITVLAFSPNGALLASGNQDGKLQLWDAATGDPHTPLHGENGILPGHNGFVHSVVFGPDGKLLVSAGSDETIRLWDVTREKQLGAPLITHIDYVDVVAFSHDGTLASGSEDGTIRLWDVRRRRQLGAPLAGHTGGEADLVFSPDGSILISGTSEGPIALWDVRHRQPLATTLASGLGLIHEMALSPDGRTLASASFDGRIELWDLASGRRLRAMASGLNVDSVAFSPDGRMLAVGTCCGLQVYDAASGRLLNEPFGTMGWVNAEPFSPDGKILAGANGDGTIQLWSVTRQPRGRFRVLSLPLRSDPSWLTSLAFSPNGKLLAAGGGDGKIRLWDVARRRLLPPPLTGHAEHVTGLAFNSRGTLLASSSQDRTIRLWDVGRHTPIGAPLIGHAEPPFAVAFSPDGTLLASGSSDTTVRLWDVASGQPIGAPLTGFGRSVTSVLFTPDGTRLIAASFDGIIRMWNVDLQGWPDRACRIANRNLSRQEWTQYLPGLPYQKTCPGLPAGS